MTSFHLVLQEALRDLELSLLRKEGRVCRALSGDAGAGKQCPRRGQARAEQGLGVWHRRRSRRLWCRASLEPPGCCMRSRSRCHYAQGPLLAGGEPKVLGASAARPSRPGHALDCILEFQSSCVCRDTPSPPQGRNQEEALARLQWGGVSGAGATPPAPHGSSRLAGLEGGGDAAGGARADGSACPERWPGAPPLLTHPPPLRLLRSASRQISSSASCSPCLRAWETPTRTAPERLAS